MSPSEPSGTLEDAPDSADFSARALQSRPLSKILVAAAVLVLLLIAALGVATWLTVRDKPTTNDEQQIANVLEDFFDYTNTGQNKKAQELVCAATRVMDSVADSEPATNPTSINRITGISVTGDKATAIVTFGSQSAITSNTEVLNTEIMDFRNQGGWKVCTPQ